jgi:hypothetical protein
LQFLSKTSTSGEAFHFGPFFQKVRKIKPEDDLDYQTETLMQILSAAENISVPRKLLRKKGPKWKASPEVLVLLRNCKDRYKEWQNIGVILYIKKKKIAVLKLGFN